MTNPRLRGACHLARARIAERWAGIGIFCARNSATSISRIPSGNWRSGRARRARPDDTKHQNTIESICGAPRAQTAGWFRDNCGTAMVSAFDPPRGLSFTRSLVSVIRNLRANMLLNIAAGPTMVRGVDGESVDSYARERRVQLQFRDVPKPLITLTSCEDKTSGHGGSYTGSWWR